MSPDTLSRKEFLGKCGTACLALAGISLLGSSCSTISYVPYTLSDKKLRVSKNDMGSKELVLIRVEQLQAPICLTKTEKGYQAVLMLCTHKSCELTSYGKVLHCPCHGSEFDHSGAVLQGPAEQALTQFIVTENEDYLYIQ